MSNLSKLHTCKHFVDMQMVFLFIYLFLFIIISIFFLLLFFFFLFFFFGGGGGAGLIKMNEHIYPGPTCKQMTMKQTFISYLLGIQNGK